MSLQEVKKLGYKLTGLKIKTSEYENTRFAWNIRKALYININKKQLQNIHKKYWRTYTLYGINKNGIYLQGLLHEIGHFKQYEKLGGKNYEINIAQNPEYCEELANRYSIKLYKRFVKSKKSWLSRA